MKPTILKSNTHESTLKRLWPQAPKTLLGLAGLLSAVSLAAPLPSLAQMLPAAGRPALNNAISAPGCIAGFRFQLSGNTYTCSSEPVRCIAPYNILEARIADNRFVYTCTRLQ